MMSQHQARRASFRVLLANPPWQEEDRLGIRAGSRWPFSIPARGRVRPSYVPFPFYLAYAASLLEQAGFELLVIDAIAEAVSEREFLNRVQDFQPNLVVLETSTPSFSTDLRIAREIRDAAARAPFIALCGPHTTAMAKQVSPMLDDGYALLIGEYELSLLRLATLLCENRRIETQPGIVRCGGTPPSSVCRAPLAAVDRLPYPARHHFPMYEYNDDFGVLPKPNVQMWASRGCAFWCSFCLWPQVMYGGQSYRARNVDDVVREMEYLVSLYGFKAVYFDDDTFNIDERRMIEFSKHLIARRFQTPWAMMARADTTSRTTISLLKEAGLVGVKLGAESGSQEILDRCNKALSVSDVERAVGWYKQLGIKTHLTFTIGLPGETWETIEKTLSFALRLDPDSAQFSIATAFPGTALFDQIVSERDLSSFDWSRFDGYKTASFSASSLSVESLERALSLLLEQWRAHTRKRSQARALKTHLSDTEASAVHIGGST